MDVLTSSEFNSLLPEQKFVYRDTPHGFNADYRPSYRKEAADDGWKRLQSWFAVYGVV